MSVQIVTAIENNVIINLTSYVNKFVNCCFREEHNKLLEKLNDKDRDSLKHKLKAELRLVKNDLMYLTYTRDPKYNDFFILFEYFSLEYVLKNSI